MKHFVEIKDLLKNYPIKEKRKNIIYRLMLACIMHFVHKLFKIVKNKHWFHFRTATEHLTDTKIDMGMYRDTLMKGLDPST